MGRSRNRGRSELEFLRGQIRQLKKELKFYKQREHFFETPTEEIEEEVENVEAEQCPSCKKGIISIFDFRFATLAKCSNCSYEKREKKK